MDKSVTTVTINYRDGTKSTITQRVTEPGDLIDPDTAKIIAEIFSNADGGCSYCAEGLASIASNRLGGKHDWKKLTTEALY